MVEEKLLRCKHAFFILLL